MVEAPMVPSPLVPDIPEIAMVPVWLVDVIVSAHAAIGNASASTASNTTTLLMCESLPKFCFSSSLTLDLLAKV